MDGKAKNLCIIQARLGSSRLPGKVLLKVKGRTLLEYEISRVERVKKINKIVVATGLNKENDKIFDLCKKIKIDCFRGSENDVLDRFYQCAGRYPEYKNIIRLTGDCPLIDPKIIDQVVEYYEQGKFDYVANSYPEETFPDGLDVEIFTREALNQAARQAKLSSEREHVTLYIKNQAGFKKGSFKADHNWGQIRLTVDNPEDFVVVKFLIEHSRPEADYLDYISILTAYPEWLLKNRHIKRNEGLLKSLKKDYNISDMNCANRKPK